MSTSSGELTSKEADMVKTSFHALEQNYKEIGPLFFQLFFKNNPEYKEFFPFKDVREEEWHENPTFLNHTLTTFKGLSVMIAAIDDQEKLEKFLSRIIKSHKKMNLTENHFINFNESVIELLSSLVNEEQLEAWKKTMNRVTDIILIGYKEENSK